MCEALVSNSFTVASQPVCFIGAVDAAAREGRRATGGNEWRTMVNVYRVDRCNVIETLMSRICFQPTHSQSYNNDED